MLDLAFTQVVFDGCRMYSEKYTFQLAHFVLGAQGFGSFVADKAETLEIELYENLEKFDKLINDRDKMD